MAPKTSSRGSSSSSGRTARASRAGSIWGLWTRLDYGTSFSLTRCATCAALSLNRGCYAGGKIQCQGCFDVHAVGCDVCRTSIPGFGQHEDDGSQTGSTASGVGDRDDGESKSHEGIAKELRLSRQKAKALLEASIPRLEQRLQQLEGKRDLNGVEFSERFRLKQGDPLKKWKKHLEDVLFTVDMPLEANFVRVAEENGSLPSIKQSFAAVLKVAQECAQCADDACGDPQVRLPSMQSTGPASTPKIIQAASRAKSPNRSSSLHRLPEVHNPQCR